MPRPPRILVVGDTILNRTYRARPSLAREVPVTFLNEELLHLSDAPTLSIQGAAHIARYLQDADPGRSVDLVTETRSAAFPGLLRAAVDGIGDPAGTVLEVDDRSAAVVTRILRDVAASRSKGPEPDYRPQLRLDAPAVPLPALLGRGRPLPAILAGAAARLGAGDLCLVRAMTREFLAGHVDASAAAQARDLTHGRILAVVQGLLDDLRGRGARVVLDLRPLPLDLRIADHEAVVCTTIGRIEDAIAGGSRRERVEAAFWRLAPARALVVFAADEGVWVALRGDLGSRGEVVRIPVTWPNEQVDGCGMVGGGDLFVAALVDALASGAGVVEAARSAAAALRVSLGAPIGARVLPADVLRARGSIHAAAAAVIHDPAGEPVLRLAEALRRGAPDVFVDKMVAPAGGRSRALREELRAIFQGWRPRPGRDLVAIFGESRSGKEFPLKAVLASFGIGVLGPVNMHQFLAETGGVIAELHREVARSGGRVALVIDEVVPDDASRSLLNLMAEKSYHRYGTVDAPLSFVESPVILLSSIDPGRLLRDMQGRLLAAVEVAPLRQRTDEIPYLIGFFLRSALGAALAAIGEVRVSERLMAALLAHEYRPIPGAPAGAGLDQQNFRALEDLLGFLGERALARAQGGVLELVAADLPELLRPLAAASLRDDAWFVYRGPFERPAVPTPPPL